MEMIQAILATGVVLAGMMILSLVMQIIHRIRIQKILTRIETLEARILSCLLTEKQTSNQISGNSSVTLEDLIRFDLTEQMNEYSPMTDYEIQKIINEMHDDPDLIPSASTKNRKK